MEKPNQPQSAAQPNQEKKQVLSVMVQKVKNGFIVFPPGVPSNGIQITANLDGALKLAKALFD